METPPGKLHRCLSRAFLITADRQHNLLVAEHGFPPEQHRLRIPLDFGPPGWVVRHQRPRIIANTDEAPDFRQILKTSPMGSTLYGPMFWRGEMLGQVLTAAQARKHLQSHRSRHPHELRARGYCCLHSPRRARMATDPRVTVYDRVSLP